MAEFYSEGATSDVANSAFVRNVLGGDATGKLVAEHNIALFSLEGITIGNAGDGHTMNAIAGDVAPTHLVKFRVLTQAGVLADYWLFARNAVT
jgi:hypothetical protein